MFRNLSLLFILLLPLGSIAQSRYAVIYGNGLGMRSGAEGIASLHYGWQKFDNRFIPLKLNTDSKALNVGYRLGKLALLDYPIAFVLPSLQHELFGHGMRVIEIGGSILEVRTPLPPPYQSELPGISYQVFISPFSGGQWRHQVHAAGSEANLVLSDLLRKNILLEDALDYHQALLYLYANNDLSGYAAFAGGMTGGDIRRYIDELNGFYRKSGLSLKQFRMYGLLQMALDPMNYYAFNSIFNGYVLQGKAESRIYMIPLTGSLKYLPKFNFGLTPYGPELMLQNYVRHEDKLYALGIGASDGTFERSWRLTADAWNVFSRKRFSFGLSAQCWSQPEIWLFEARLNPPPNQLGAMFLAKANYDLLSGDNKLGLTLRAGYKSPGFVFGEWMDKGLILRGGLSFQLK